MKWPMSPYINVTWRRAWGTKVKRWIPLLAPNEWQGGSSQPRNELMTYQKIQAPPIQTLAQRFAMRALSQIPSCGCFNVWHTRGLEDVFCRINHGSDHRWLQVKRRIRMSVSLQTRSISSSSIKDHLNVRRTLAQDETNISQKVPSDEGVNVSQRKLNVSKSWEQSPSRVRDSQGS